MSNGCLKQQAPQVRNFPRPFSRAGDDVCEAERICETLARKGLMLRAAGAAEWPNGIVAGRYAFLHSLYQEVFYQRIAPGQRARLHRQLGERLEQDTGKRPQKSRLFLLFISKKDGSFRRPCGISSKRQKIPPSALAIARRPST